MEQAQQAFADIQARGRELVRAPDPRPALAAALMRAMEDEIALRLFKPFPTLLTRHLCGRDASADLGLNRRQPLLSRLVFTGGLALVRAIDATVRLIVPGFSISRMLTRAFGYRLVTRFLMDQTRPLRLPDALLGQVQDALGQWRRDPRAPRWLNRLEARLAGHGAAAAAVASPDADIDKRAA